MQNTTNYNLNKPDGNDYAKVEALNENFDVIDETIANLEYAVNNIDFSGIEQDISDVKTVVDSTKIKIDEIDTRTGTINTNTMSTNSSLGAPGNVASNLTTATAQAKLNWLLTNVGTLIEGRVVKSIQRGSVNLTNQSPSVVVNITKVDPNKSFINTTGSSVVSTSGGMTGVNGAIANTGLTITVYGASVPSFSTTASWQVIEFY